MLVLLLGGHKMSIQSIVKEQFGDSFTECGQLEQQRERSIYRRKKFSIAKYSILWLILTVTKQIDHSLICLDSWNSKSHIILNRTFCFHLKLLVYNDDKI